MKIDSGSVAPQQKLNKVQDSQSKTQEVRGDVPSQVDERPVVVNLNSRNSVDVSTGGSSGEILKFSADSFNDIKQSIMTNPETVFRAQSNSTPERVLALLA